MMHVGNAEPWHGLWNSYPLLSWGNLNDWLVSGRSVSIVFCGVNDRTLA